MDFAGRFRAESTDYRLEKSSSLGRFHPYRERELLGAQEKDLRRLLHIRHLTKKKFSSLIIFNLPPRSARSKMNIFPMMKNLAMARLPSFSPLYYSSHPSLRSFSSSSSAHLSTLPPPTATLTSTAIADGLELDGAQTAAKHFVQKPLQPGVIVYDGVCHLCHQGVKWVINADKYKKIKFCCLQSKAAEPYLDICDVTREDVSRRFIFIEGFGLYHQASTAALKVLSHLPLPYSALSTLMVIPTPLRDAAYDYVAKRRYDWFGKAEDCLVMKEPELLERFIDAEELWKKKNSSM